MAPADPGQRPLSPLTAGAVASLHRYPVKSMTGETVAALDVEDRGVVGDRLWAVLTADGRIGSGKRTRRFEPVDGLLRLRARLEDGIPVVGLPGGEWVAVSDPGAGAQLTRHLGREVTLAREADVDHFDDGPVSLVAAASVDALAAELGADLDPARFRPNLVVAGWPAYAEDALVGHIVRIGGEVGGVLLEVTTRSPRCVMVAMESADLPAQPGVLRATGRANDACLGVIARVLRPGRIRAGDPVEVLAERMVDH